MGVFQITTGSMGVGKSYCFVRWLVTEFLLDKELILITNIDLKIDAIAQHMMEKHDHPIEFTKSRILRIPESEINRWRAGQGGPWSYFDGQHHEDDPARVASLTNCHVAIDESHEVCSTYKSKAVQEQWLMWIRTVRHLGATVEFLTQTDSDFPGELKKICQKRVHISDGADIRDPYFYIPMSHWQQLWSKYISGKYVAMIARREYAVDNGKESRSETRWFGREPLYFSFYDSFQATADGHSGARRKLPWELYGRFRFAFWFVSQNWFRVVFSSRTWVMLAALFLLCGGGPWLMSVMQSGINDAVHVATVGGRQSSKKDLKEDPPIKEEEVLITVSQRVHELHKAEHARLLDLQLVNHARIQELQQQLTYAERRVEILSRITRSFMDLTAKGSMLRMIGKDRIVVETGEIYAVGDEIMEGQYHGRKLVSINHEKRSVTLDDGTILRMSADALLRRDLRLQAERDLAGGSVPSEQQTGPRLSTLVPRGRGVNAPSGGGNASSDSDHSVGRSDATQSLTPVHRNASRLLDHDGQRSESATGDN